MEAVRHTLPAVAAEAPTAPEPGFRTWHLFAALTVASMLVAWVNTEWVMTREVYHTLLGAQLDAERIDRHFDFIRQTQKWGYLGVPLIVAIRAGLVALLVQTLALLFMVEVPFRKLFRAALIAFPATLLAAAVKAVWLLRLGPGEITEQSLEVVPGSLAAFLPGLETGTPVYYALSMLSFWEAIWVGLLAYGLRATGKMKTGAAAGVALTVWLVTAFFMWGLSVYLSRV